MDLSSFYAPIGEDLAEVDRRIVAVLSDADGSVDNIGKYLSQQSGKRLRPALLIQSYKANADFGPASDAVYDAAVALELIHMASLIHDDIIDQAEFRHKMPSVWKQFGKDKAIVSGVWLYSLALDCLARTGRISLVQRVSQAVRLLCTGELMQIHDRGNLDMNLPTYTTVLEQKTGALFKAACECGLDLAGANDFRIKAAGEFGNYLGILFQLTDDLMDFYATNLTLGKKPGQDLFSQEMTLPLFFLFGSCTLLERKAIEEKIRAQDVDAFSLVRENFSKYNVYDQTMAVISDYQEKAAQCLEEFPENETTKWLYGLLPMLAARVHAHS